MMSNVRKIIKDINAMQATEYYQSDARTGIVSASYTDVQVRDIIRDKDTAIVQRKQMQESRDNYKQEVIRLNKRLSAQGKLQRLGYKLDKAINTSKLIIIEVVKICWTSFRKLLAKTGL